MNRKLDKKIWGIFVHGMQDQEGNGYFRACLDSETDDNNQPLGGAVCSTSKVGFFAAAINLCKRLDKSKKHSFPETPAKWGIYFVNSQTKIPMINHGYILVEENSRYGTFTAHLMAPPILLEDPEMIEEYIRNEWLNSVEDSTSQTEFSALGNLCRKLDAYGGAQTIDSIVLDPIAADFFMPVAIQNED